ncbi:hypothetical protein Barb4_01140 [Bacteroidales bacterium Barb4]|nr:hypothetical protein Barb4_01140 [Bacteroidales bacterium Barb4]
MTVKYSTMINDRRVRKVRRVRDNGGGGTGIFFTGEGL